MCNCPGSLLAGFYLMQERTSARLSSEKRPDLMALVACLVAGSSSLTLIPVDMADDFGALGVTKSLPTSITSTPKADRSASGFNILPDAGHAGDIGHGMQLHYLPIVM